MHHLWRTQQPARRLREIILTSKKVTIDVTRITSMVFKKVTRAYSITDVTMNPSIPTARHSILGLTPCHGIAGGIR
jgi:hypothetical protein